MTLLNQVPVTGVLHVFWSQSQMEATAYARTIKKLNCVSKVDSFPIPRIEDCIDRVGSAKDKPGNCDEDLACTRSDV